ncbi:hypothetical protein SIM22_05970 [Bacillus cereus group sp. BfR-BA-01363]|uniref:hypothetical protein n=1 Tax=Bacillus cereus group sp. BfR-BA-01363 TaxID=3094882 RepID=UPI0029C5CE26|nr:hypothetical protein [Bacillus cereus group sp. BfR-BA-01363]MDX5853650.1 hypothetical protein [Bacillus cereus group sp. BfR-BA-01363]
MECYHNAISLAKGYPQCLDCGKEFRNGELGRIRKEREDKCNHSRLDHGYASNPPTSWCPDCGGYFSDLEIKNMKDKQVKKEEI